MIRYLLGLAEITLAMGAVILCLLLLLRLVGRRFTARCRYLLWLLVALRLAVPCGAVFLPALHVITLPTEIAEEKVQTTPVEPETLPTVPAWSEPSVTWESSPSAATNPASTPESSTPRPAPAVTDTQEIMPIPSDPPAAADTPPLRWSWHTALTLLSAAVLTGSAVMLIWHAIAYRIRTAEILRSARAADEALIRLCETVCRRLKLRRVPRILLSENVSGPMAFGVFRPTVVLPARQLEGNMLAATLLHEITHLSRGDLFVKLLLLWGRSLHWFNPLVHIAAAQCETEMELSCDEAVLAGYGDDVRNAYGTVVLDIARQSGVQGGALTTQFRPGKQALAARLSNILYGSGKRKGRVLLALCAALCILAGSVVACRLGDTTDPFSEETTDPSGENAAESDADTQPPVIPDIPTDADIVLPLADAWETVVPVPVELTVLDPDKIAMADIVGNYAQGGPLQIGERTVTPYSTSEGPIVTLTEADGTVYILHRIAGVYPPELSLTSFTDVLGRDGFCLYYAWTHATTLYYVFDETGAPEEFLSFGNAPASGDFDGDGTQELLRCESWEILLYELEAGAAVRADLKPLLAEHGIACSYIKYRSEKGDFLLSCDDGYYTAVYRENTFYLTRVTEEYLPLMQSADGRAELYYHISDEGDSMGRMFQLRIQGKTADITPSLGAWLSYTWKPQLYAFPFVDNRTDVIAIFTTGTGTGVHTEEAYFLDGDSETLTEVPHPAEAVEAFVTRDRYGNATYQNGHVAVKLPQNVSLYQNFKFQVAGGTLTADVQIGYGVLQYEDEYFTVTYEKSGDEMIVASIEYKVFKPVTKTMTVPIEGYRYEGDTLGEMRVYLTYDASLLEDDGQPMGECTALAIRSDDIAVSKDELMTYGVFGHAPVYTLTQRTAYYPSEGWNYSGTQYRHGMNEKFLAIYGAQADAAFRARREYMYLLSVETNTYLLLIFRPGEGEYSAAEELHYTSVAATVQAEIRMDRDVLSDYALEAVRNSLKSIDEMARVSTGRSDERLYLGGLLAPEKLLDIMRLEEWERVPIESEPMTRDLLIYGVTDISIYPTRAEDVLEIKLSGKDGGYRLAYRTPAGTAERIMERLAEEKDEQAKDHDARLAAIAAYLPDGATEQLVMRKIFMSQDYILAYRTADHSISLWRAEDLGDRYVRLTLELPNDRTFDYAEVVGASGGGGSGEYVLLVALYSGDTVEYIRYGGWFREQPARIEDWESDNEAESLFDLGGKNVIFPNKNAPRAIRDFDDWEQLGLAPSAVRGENGEDCRLTFLRAFLGGDVDTLVSLVGGAEDGMYDDIATLRFYDYVIYAGNPLDNGEVPLYISFIFDESASDVFPNVGMMHTYRIGEGIDGILFAGRWEYGTVNTGVTGESADTLHAILNTVSTPEIPMTNDMEEGRRWQMSEYIVNALGGGAYTVEEVAAYAKTYFGITDFLPDSLHVKDGMVTPLPHGGTHIEYQIRQREDIEGEVGRQRVRAVFFADSLRWFVSCQVDYYFEKVGDGWALIGYVVVEDSGNDTYSFSV